MFAHLSRLFKHSVVYGMSETISRGTGFILMFIYVRIISYSEIGIRSSFYFASAFLALFYTFGLDNAFLRYFLDEDYKNRKGTLFSSAIYFTILTGLIFMIVPIVWGNTVSNLITDSEYYIYITRLLFIILILDSIVIYPSLVLRAENRFLYYLFISFSRFFLFILLNLVMVWYFKRGVRGIFEANLMVVFIIFLLLLPVYRKYFSGRISFPIMKKMLLFGVPTIFTILAMRIIDFSDRRIILYFLGESQVGKYTVAYNLGMVGIMVFVNSFRTAWQPFFLSLKSNSESKIVFSRVATYYAIIICMVFLGLVLFRDEILHIYDPNISIGLSAIIPFVAVSYILYGFYIIMLPGVFIREKTKYLPLATFAGAFVNIALNILFIPRYGIIGAAYATVISYIVMVVILYVISRYIYLVKYEIGRIMGVFIFTVVPIIISLVYLPDSLIWKLLYNCFLCLIPPAVYIFSSFLSTDEKVYIRQKLKQCISGKFLCNI